MHVHKHIVRSIRTSQTARQRDDENQVVRRKKIDVQPEARVCAEEDTTDDENDGLISEEDQNMKGSDEEQARRFT